MLEHNNQPEANHSKEPALPDSLSTSLKLLEKPELPVEIADSPELIAALGKELLAEKYFSVDTEIIGFEEGNEKLCLIQITLPSQQKTVLIDPIARISDNGDIEFQDLNPLKEAFENPEIKKIAHNADFEQRQFARHGLGFEGVIDTLKLVREFRPDMKRYSLDICCRYILGLDISKEEQTSDWSQRPLSESQLDYGSIDPEVTLKLYEALRPYLDAQQELASLKPEQLLEVMFNSRKNIDSVATAEAPELFELGAKEKGIERAIASRLVLGEGALELEHGAIIPPRARSVLPLNRVIKRLLPKIESPELPDQLSEALADATYQVVIRRQVTDALKKVGLNKLGIIGKGSLTRFYDSVSDEPEQRFDPEIKLSYQSNAPRPEYSPSTHSNLETLMKEYADTVKTRLSILRELDTDLSLERFRYHEAQRLLQQYGQQIEASSISTEYGNVVIGNERQRINPELLDQELRPKLTKLLGKNQAEEIISELVNTNVTRRGLSQLLRNPRFAELGLGGDELPNEAKRKEFIEACSETIAGQLDMRLLPAL